MRNDACCLVLHPLPSHNAHSSLTDQCANPTQHARAPSVHVPACCNTAWTKHKANAALDYTLLIHTRTQDIVIPIAFPPGHGKGFVATSGLHPRAPRMMRDQGMLLFVGKQRGWAKRTCIQ